MAIGDTVAYFVQFGYGGTLRNIMSTATLNAHDG